MNSRFLSITIVIVIVVIASFGFYEIFNSSHRSVSPPHLIVGTTPHAYMEVNFSNLSHSSEMYSISFTAVTKDISLSGIELKTLSGSSIGVVHFNSNSSQYTLNISSTSIFNVTVHGGYVFSDFTSIVLKYFSGDIQSFTSITFLDVVNDVVISQSLMNQNLSQNSTLTPEASMAISETSLGATPQCYALSFSDVTSNISINGIELEIYNGSLNGTIHFGDIFSQYTMNLSDFSNYTLNVYGGNVFSNSTYITIKLLSGAPQSLTLIKLIDYDTSGTIASITLY